VIPVNVGNRNIDRTRKKLLLINERPRYIDEFRTRQTDRRTNRLTDTVRQKLH